MSAIGVQSQINSDRALWLSSIPNDVVHSTILTDLLIANAGYISSFYSDNSEISSLKVSTLSQRNADVSGMYVSSIRGNAAFFSSMVLASDLSGGVGYVRFSTDASGIQVDGDPIRFDNLVYLTSTINIVQVSTIVDTDIFAQKGYFSTLSTGSLSTGEAYLSTVACIDLSGTNARFDTLFVSSLEALDISGVAASNWSQYPTLASSIIFQPAYILSNVNNQLFFAGQELTDASGGGADWSIFPAYSTVQMANQSFAGVSTVQFQDGATLTSVTGNDLLYNGQAVQYGSVSNVSQWASYPAVSTINTAGYGITSPGNLTTTVTSNARVLAGSFSTVADQGLAVTTNSDINLTAQNGLKGRINLTANPGTAGLFGEINMVANGGTVAGVGTGGLVSITANTPFGTLCNATSAIKLSAAGVNSYAGAIPSVGSLAGYNFIYGQGGVNICAGIPSVFPNVPLTTFLYGTAGVTTSSDLYVPNIYPYWNGLTTPPDMLISGRYILPNLAQVYVQLSNVKYIYMEGAADIYGVNSLYMSNGYLSNVSTIQMTNGTITGANSVSGSGSVSGYGAMSATAASFQGLSVSTISASGNVAFGVSTFTNQLTWTNAVGQSTSLFGDTAIFNRIVGLPDGVNPNVSRIENFSSIQSGTLSTINLTVSTINGVPLSSIQTPANIICSNATVEFSTVTSTLLASFVQTSTIFAGTLSGLSSVVNVGQFGDINLFEDLTGVTNPGDPLRTRIVNFSSIQSGTISTIDLVCSTINGQPPGSGGGGTINSFSTLQVSTLFGIPTGAPITGNPGSTITINSGLTFIGDGLGTPGTGGRYLSSLRFINSSSLTIRADSLFIENPGTGTIRIGGGGAYDAQFVPYGLGTGLSTVALLTSSIITDGFLEISGGLIPTGRIELADGNGINFDDFSATVFTRLERRDIATSNMLAVTNNPGLASNNLNPLAVGELWLTGGADTFSRSCRLYTQFPYGNYELDAVDENGVTLFAFLQGYYQPFGLNPGFVQAFSNVSSISGYNENSAIDPQLSVIGGIVTSNLTISSINGAAYPPGGGGGGTTSQFSTLFVSSLNFSSATSYTSNTAINYPIFVEHDAAGATSNSGAAIVVQGHNYSGGSVIQQIEMGWRATGENYILSYWPGQNLEDLQIESSQLLITNGGQSSFMNYAGHALQTGNDILVGETQIAPQSISTLDFSVSSINGNDARPAYLNALTLSSMLLYSGSTTLMYWTNRTAESNINISGYDAVVGVNGTYKIGTSFQFLSPGSADEVEFFVLKNNVPISYGGGVCSVQNNEEIIQYCEIVEPLINGDSIQVGCFTNGANVYVSTITGTVIESPAVILTMYKVD